MKKKEKKVRIEGATRAFQVVAGVFFTLFLISLILTICASRRGIKKLTKEYVYSIEVEDTYFDNYIEAGFSTEMCYELLDGNVVKDTVSYVMYDRVVSIFHNSTSYEYSIDYCKEQIRSEIERLATSNSVVLESYQIEALTSYTLDICGISSMFIYDTPVLYRTSIFDASNEDIGSYSEMFKSLSTLTSPLFPVSLGIMYFVCIFILLVICERETINRLYLLVCDTTLIPSLVCLAISVAKLFGDNTDNLLTNYVFSKAIIIAIIGLLIGFVEALVTMKIFKKI